jgi:hypothetical protein
MGKNGKNRLVLLLIVDLTMVSSGNGSVASNAIRTDAHV